jgi:hypothetical protein
MSKLKLERFLLLEGGFVTEREIKIINSHKKDTKFKEKRKYHATQPSTKRKNDLFPGQ